MAERLNGVLSKETLSEKEMQIVLDSCCDFMDGDKDAYSKSLIVLSTISEDDDFKEWGEIYKCWIRMINADGKSVFKFIFKSKFADGYIKFKEWLVENMNNKDTLLTTILPLDFGGEYQVVGSNPSDFSCEEINSQNVSVITLIFEYGDVVIQKQKKYSKEEIEKIWEVWKDR